MQGCASPNSNQQLVIDCSGDQLSGQDLFTFWNTHPCIPAYSQAINTAANGTLLYNPSCQNSVRQEISALFTNYLSTNTFTDDVTDPAYNTFQNTLVELCTLPTLPGVCTDALTSFCAAYTRDQVVNSNVLTNLCGCYVSPDPNTNLPAVCDALCNRATTSQVANNETGIIDTCNENVCVISQVQINTINSQLGNNPVSFNNLCPECGVDSDNPCVCIISGINIGDTLGSVGITTNFNQFCGPNSQCVVEDEAGNVISKGPCPTNNPIPVNQYSSAPVWGVVAIMLVILVIVIIGVIVIRSAK